MVCACARGGVYISVCARERDAARCDSKAIFVVVIALFITECCAQLCAHDSRPFGVYEPIMLCDALCFSVVFCSLTKLNLKWL